MKRWVPNLKSKFNPIKVIYSHFIAIVLLLIMCSTIWFILSTHGNLKSSQLDAQDFEEMSEFTAHMLRLADQNTYYQSVLRRLNSSFKWEKDIEDISSPALHNEIELFLFDAKGKRLPWPDKDVTKIRASENYVGLLKKLIKEPHIALTRTELSMANIFSGNSNTIYQLTQLPETIINFQGIGLNKHGIFFSTKFHDGSKGNLLAWIDSEKIDIHKLANHAISFMEERISKDYQFFKLDLNHKNKGALSKQKCTDNEFALLTSNTLNSNIVHKNKLYAIADTTEGIRLVCTRQKRSPPAYLDFFTSLLYSLIPGYFLFIIWQLVFKVNFNLSITTEFVSIILILTVLGALIFLSSGALYINEKEKSLTENYKQKAIQILEKTDKNFIFSYNNLEKNYRKTVENLAKPNADIKSILNPIIPTKPDDPLTFASYINKNNRFEFITSINKTEKNKYFSILNAINAELLNLYNANKNNKKSSQPKSLESLTITSRKIITLLMDRAKFQYTVFDIEEKLTFVDLITDENDLAVATFFALHEPKKLQLRYLTETATNILKNTGLQLVAFPKNHIEKSAYFPKYSLSLAEPLWKLQDLINQTKINSYKTGTIENENTLVVGIPGHNLKDYNLFLLIPTSKITQTANENNNLYYIAYASTILFLLIMSYLIIKAIINPIHQLSINIKTAKQADHRQLNLTHKPHQRLEGASLTLINFVKNIIEFNSFKNAKKYLMPSQGIENENIKITANQVASNEAIEIYEHNFLDNNNAYAFIVRIKEQDVEGMLISSIIQTAINIILEKQNVLSPCQCIKELLTYMQINHRKVLNADISMIYIDVNENMAHYSSNRKQNLITYNGHETNHMTEKTEEIENISMEIDSLKSITMISSEKHNHEAINKIVSKIKSNEEINPVKLINKIENHKETLSIIHIELKNKNE